MSSIIAKNLGYAEAAPSTRSRGATPSAIDLGYEEAVPSAAELGYGQTTPSTMNDLGYGEAPPSQSSNKKEQATSLS